MDILSTFLFRITIKIIATIQLKFIEFDVHLVKDTS